MLLGALAADQVRENGPAVALRGSMTKSVVISEPAVCSGWLASRAQVLLALVRQQREELLRQRIRQLR